MLKYNIVVDTFLGTLKIQILDKINNQFPILVQGAMCAARLDLKDGNIHIKVIDINGNILKETLLKAQ